MKTFKQFNEAAKSNKKKLQKYADQIAYDVVYKGKDLTVASSWANDEMKAMIDKQIKVYQAKKKKPGDHTLTGRVKKETAKAVLFVDKEYGQVWWPLSQVKVIYRAIGAADQLVVPDWIIKKRLAEMS